MKKAKYELDPSGLSYGAIAKRLGLNRNAIFVMRNQQRVKFDYIKSLDPYFEKAYRMYERKVNAIQQDLQNIYYELEEVKKLKRFSEVLCDAGFYTAKASWSNGIVLMAFGCSGSSIPHESFIKKEKIVKFYKENKDANLW